MLGRDGGGVTEKRGLGMERTGGRGHVADRHAPCIISHMKSKLKGFDKSGAWPMNVNIQPDNYHQLI